MLIVEGNQKKGTDGLLTRTVTPNSEKNIDRICAEELSNRLKLNFEYFGSDLSDLENQ